MFRVLILSCYEVGTRYAIKLTGATGIGARVAESQQYSFIGDFPK